MTRPGPLRFPLPAPRPLAANLLRAGILAAAALLAGCPGDGGQDARQLESITVTDADGKVVTVSRFDYADGDLVRVRAYNQPGDDGIVGTDDDPLARGNLGDLDRLMAPGEGYTRCEVARELNQQLHDPYAEQLGDGRLERLFATHTDCVLPGQSASRVTSIYLTSPGADGLWFTADDTASYQRILERTADGSKLWQGLPEFAGAPLPPAYQDTAYNINATGLNNIVYDPYAGFGATLPIHYGYDNRGRVTTLQSDVSTQRFTYAEDGALAQRELIQPSTPTQDSNIIVDLFLLQVGRYREEYRRLDAERSAVESYALVDKAVYDNMVTSPTMQIMLAILGLDAEGEATLDGQAYVKLGIVRYVVDRGNEQAETVTRLTATGADGEWFTADDVAGSTATLRYTSSPRPQQGSRGARDSTAF